MREYFKNRTYLAATIIFAVWSAVLAACNILSGDDIVWTLHESQNDVFGDTSINGRYFTNAVTFVAVRYFFVRFIVAFIFVFLLHQLITRLIDKGGQASYTSVFSAVCIMTLNQSMFTMTLNWISGITNYVISAVILLSYLLYCKPVFYGKKPEYKKALCFIPLLLGFFGALCVENVTIYSILLGIFVIAYSYKQYKSFYPGHILYLVGTAVGAAIMFTNHTYSSLWGGSSDEAGFRDVQIDFSDISHQIYEELMAYYCVAFWILHIVICVSFLLLYSKKFSGETKPPKYTFPALCISVIYTAYSFFTNIFGGFAVWNAGLTIRAIETAFTFTYFLSLIYLGWVLCSREAFVRFAFYVMSTAILSAPFAVVNPVTERCFFTDFIFWVLAAGEISVYAGIGERFGKSAVMRFASTLTAGYIAFTISYMCIWNKYTDVMRFNYIKTQVEEGKSTIEIIKLPYPSYVPRDELLAYKSSIDENKKQNIYGKDNSIININLRLGDELMESHDIDVKLDEKNIVLISLYDYSLKE